MKRLFATLCLGALVMVTACGDNSAAPEKTGSISLELISPPAEQGVAPVAAAASGDETGATLAAPQSRAPAEPTSHLQSIRVTVSGPTNKAATFQCTATCEGTIDGLDPGSYSVVVEGLVGTEVDHFGNTTGVNVAAGSNTTATISFQSFRPVLNAFTPDTTEVLRFTASWPAVAAAASYVVEFSQAADFAGATSKPVTGTSTEIVVTQEARYYVRVRAINSVVSSGGRASDAKSVVALLGVATVTVTPATVTIAPGATQQFTAEARDADNNLVPNVSFFWSSSNHNVATVTQSGLATGVGKGQVTITAVAKGQPGSATLDVTVGPPEKLAFTVQPSNVGLGGTIAPAIAVAIVDRLGNVVTTATNSVTVSIGTNPSGGSLSGTRTVAGVDGVAIFGNLKIGETGSGYTLVANSPALTGATSAAFNVTHRALVVHNVAAGTVSVIETATNTKVATITVGSGPRKVAYKPDGTQAYVTNGTSNTVSVINTATNAVTATVPVGTEPHGLAVTPNGARVYVTNNFSNNVSVFNTSNNTIAATIAVGALPNRVAITPNGNFAYVTNFSSSNVSVINTTTLAVVATIIVGSGPQGIAITPDGAFAYVANASGSTVSVIRTSDNTVVATVSVGAFPVGVAIKPDGTAAYVVNQGSANVSVISTFLNAVVGRVDGLSGEPRNIAITPGGAFAYITNQLGTVFVVSTATNKVLGTIAAGASGIFGGVAVAPSP